MESNLPLKKLLFFTFLAIVFSNGVKAQLTITTGSGVSASSIINSLIGSGVAVSNITEDCNQNSRGIFSATGATSTALQMTNGVLFSTGKAVSAIPAGGNGSCCEEAIDNMLGSKTDPDLQGIVPGKSLNDICKLEFDLRILGDSLYIEYVFGSEEHPKWAPPLHSEGDYNDAFGFFISGPGITGVQNIAKVPGTTSDVSVLTINTVNNPLYFVENYSTKGCTITGGCGSNTSTLEYNGYTRKMIAKIKVLNGATYHVKLAIADVGDYILNSGAFIKAGSIAGIGNVLPIALTQFDAKLDKGRAILNWQTLTELNLAYFEILRSSDGLNYQTIAKVNGVEKSTSPKYYSFIDDQPIKGFSYYRIRQVDYNGSYSYSSTASLNLSPSIKLFGLYPNPVESNITGSIEMHTEGSLLSEILDIRGSVITSKIFNLSQGLNTISLETDHLEQGVYFIRLSGENFNTVTGKFVK